MAIIDFETFKLSVIVKIKKSVSNILDIVDDFLEAYKKYKHESDPKQKKFYKERAFELMKLIHYNFSDIENQLREYKYYCETNKIDLEEEEIPEFEDFIEMTKEEFEKFKKENDFDEQRMIIWLRLFKKKIIYLTKVIQKDLKENKNVNKKIKLINQFYRQIFVAYKVILNDAFMIGAPQNKIKII